MKQWNSGKNKVMDEEFQERVTSWEKNAKKKEKRVFALFSL